jgi:hypothetical protein
MESGIDTVVVAQANGKMAPEFGNGRYWYLCQIS